MKNSTKSRPSPEKIEVKPQHHWSHLSMYQKCGEAYRRRYIENEIVPPAAAIHIGKGTHASIEANLEHLIEHKTLLPDDEVADAARDAVNDSWDESGVDESSETNRGEAVDMTVKLALCHHAHVAPNLRPHDIERPWVIELPKLPFNLAGQIDIDEWDTIRDTKTTARRQPQRTADLAGQFTLYSKAKQVIDGVLPTIAVDYLIKGPVAVAETLYTRRTDEDFRALLYRFVEFDKALRKGIFPPAAADAWNCDPKWCGYARTCKYFNRR